MNRKYKAQDFIDICKKIKSKNPKFRITTDAIVGFPTETKTDFLKTKELISKCDIKMVYIGKYSPRKGTAAYKLKDTVNLETKKKREKILRDIVNKTRLREHKKLVGEKIPVLMYTPTKGISYYNHDVLTKNSYKPGQFYNLLVKNYHKSGLIC
jgi:threonylcarbamoyladenosine tRNA methylthiotransferase MtaB